MLSQKNMKFEAVSQSRLQEIEGGLNVCNGQGNCVPVSRRDGAIIGAGVGAAIGSAAGPVGTLVGAVIGGILGWFA